MAAKTDKPPRPRKRRQPRKVEEAARLPTALLRHDTADGHHHYDWLIADPRTAANPNAKLWTARVTHPSSEWAKLKRWPLEPIGDHRREYLTYEGPVSNNRGKVRRVDEGTFVALSWTDNHMTLNVAMRSFNGTIEIRRGKENRWEATVIS